MSRNVIGRFALCAKIVVGATRSSVARTVIRIDEADMTTLGMKKRV